MLNVLAKEGLARILGICNLKDVEILEVKLVPGLPTSTSQEEAAEAILKHVQKPSELLLQKNVKREIIVLYLEEIGVRVPQGMGKDACIRICLKKWHVKDDDFWVKPRRSVEKNRRDLSQLNNYMSKEIQEVTVEPWIETDDLTDNVDFFEERNGLQQLTEQSGNEDVQVFSPTALSTEAASMESLDFSGENLPTSSSPSSVSGTYEQKRKSSSLTTSPVDSVSFDSFRGPSTLLQESFDCFLPFRKAGRKESVSPSVPSRCSSAPPRHDFSHSIFPSKTTNFCSSGENPTPGMTSAQYSSPDPFSISSQAMGENHLDSGKKRKSVSDISVSSSASSHRIYKKERDSPELQSTEPFTLSRDPMAMDVLPSASIMERSYEESPTATSASPAASSYPLFREERETYEVTQPSTSKTLLVRPSSVSDASVQTFMSKPFVNTSVLCQTNQSGISSDEHSSSHENPREKTVNSKRRSLENAASTYNKSYHRYKWKDSSSLSKRKGCTAEVSDMKRNRWTPLSNSEDRSSAFRNLNRSESPLESKKHVSSFFYSDPNKSEVSSKPDGNKRIHPASMSKELSSFQKQQHPSLPSKRAKSVSVDQKLSTLTGNKKIFKRKLPSSSLKEEETPRCQSTLPPKHPRYTSVSSSEHRQQSKVAAKKVNSKSHNHLRKPKNEVGVASFQKMSRKPLRSELTPMGPESSAHKLLAKNSSNDTTESVSSPSSVPPQLMCDDESELTSPDGNDDISERNEGASTGCSSSPPDLQETSRPRRYCCAML